MRESRRGIAKSTRVIRRVGSGSILVNRYLYKNVYKCTVEFDREFLSFATV